MRRGLRGGARARESRSAVPRSETSSATAPWSWASELGARVQLTAPESPKLKVSLDVGVSRGRVSFFPRCELVSRPEEERTAAGFGGFVGLVIERARLSQ